MSWNIVASDMDGTLLAPDHKVSEFTKSTLGLLEKRGIPFVIATGRPYADVLALMKQMGLRGYAITSNGSRVHDPDGNEIITNDISPSVVREILTHATANYTKVSTNVYRHAEWLTNHKVQRMSDVYKQTGFDSVVSEDLANAPADGVHELFFVGQPEDLLEIEKDMNARWGDKVDVSFSHFHILDCVLKNVNKGFALDGVAKLLGFTVKDCVAFGDGMNDKAMLEVAGKGIIMENGQERLKQALPHLEIIGKNSDDSVAHFLRNTYKLEEEQKQ